MSCVWPTDGSMVGLKNECCVGPQRVQWLD